MKRTGLTYLVALALMAAMGCQRNSMDDGCRDAALVLYSQYAGNDQLTVAYLGDYKMHGELVNAVMIQADDEGNWGWLQDEFGVPKESIRMAGNHSGHQDYSINLSVSWDASSLVNDEIINKEHLDDAEINLFAQTVVDQLNAALGSLDVSGAKVENASVSIVDGVDLFEGLQLDTEFHDETAVPRIMQAVMEKLNATGLHYEDTVVDADAKYIHLADTLELDLESYRKLVSQNQSMMENAQSHDKVGYLTVVDYGNRTLWVFFYSSLEECHAIMSHIRKDILAFPDNDY